MSQQAAEVLDQRSTVEAVRSAHRFELNLPVLGAVPVPPPEQLAYFAAMGLMVAFEIIEWPIALTIAAGHLLATEQHNRILEEVGEALEGV
ncbi:hypothetical protein B2J88_03065 [Rhodococcus sp. SRB_17]|uniref:hypothetical protein n=1 Tax=Rhodococcus sp. OK302 TaxID=1882769 RepID=UPI000B942AB0|nr:hypothetical protein [Rhodococcus sp. OK302]NMM83346.1 hypothetical protein [Rhodococcus sp. SRB_17]OYD71438.1 hypothetical protein BDB13_5113 [Rhodococcus sp. OK302]